jgi:thioesterase domain-containing protein
MNVNCTDVEQYLHEHIPLSKAMAVSVSSIDSSGVILSAPLQPNINHRSTVFGGSISAVSILSAWTLVHVRLQMLTIPCQIVIQSSNIDYTKPIETDFQVCCLTPAERDWERFIATIIRHGKGRIVLNAEVYCQGILSGKFQGEYVALKHKS